MGVPVPTYPLRHVFPTVHRIAAPGFSGFITIRHCYTSLTKGNTQVTPGRLGLVQLGTAPAPCPRSFTARSNMSVFTRSRTAGFLGGIAIVGASALVLVGCSAGGTGGATSEAPSEERDLTLKIGTILPQTGTLAFLGPPEEAGVGLAAQDINDAAVGIDDPRHRLGRLGRHRQQGLRDHDPEAHLRGRVGRGRRRLVGRDQALPRRRRRRRHHHVLAGQHVARLHRRGTTTASTGAPLRPTRCRARSSATWSPKTATRTSRSCTRTTRTAPGLNKVFQDTFTGTGGTIVEEQSYNTGDTTFDAQISAILASAPDAIVLITFDEIYTIGPGADRGGLPRRPALPRRRQPEELRFGREVAGRSQLEGAKGTTPAGPATPEDFQGRLNDWWTGEGNAELTDFSYANESYDAVILLALASLAANSTDPAEIAAHLQEVSGGSGDGEKCTEFAECADIILGGGTRGLRRLLGPDHVRRERRPDRGHDRCLPVRSRQPEQAHRPLSRPQRRAPERSGALSLCGSERASVPRGDDPL